MQRKTAACNLLFILSSSLIFLSGCDQIQGMFQPNLASGKPKIVVPKEAQPQETEPAVQGTVLAKINNQVITLESFDEKIKAIQAFAPDAKLNTYDAKKNYLNDLVTQELIIQEAKARGIDKRKDIGDAVDEFKKGALAKQLVLDETKGITIEPQEIETFYNQYKKEFAAPEEIKVREIVVASEAAAKEILIAILQGGDFAAIAKERSSSKSAPAGGDLGFIKLSEKFENFGKAVAVLDAGQVSPIFKGPDGFYIVKVEEKKGGIIPPMNDVYEQIKTGLMQQKQVQRIKDLTDKLKRDAKIEIKEDLLR